MASTKLRTTMGVELTFLSPAMQVVIDSLNPTYDKNPDQFLSGNTQSDICRAYVEPMREALVKAKQPVKDVHVDPGCLEVPTMPYKTRNMLQRAISRVWKCAHSIGMVSTLPSFYGGGAHIHTGRIGETGKEIDEYTGRMFVFANRNPWLTWAFVGLTDGTDGNATNAAPLPLEHFSILHRDRDYWQDRVNRYREKIINYTRSLHSDKWHFADGWIKRHIQNSTREYMQARLGLKRYNADAGIPVESFRGNCGKSHMLRETSYGKKGTIEFRAFEMPEDKQTLFKYIDLVDKIVAHVAAQDYKTVAVDSLLTEAQTNALTWRQRRDGFVRMLEAIGADPADYKAERVQIALKLRLAAAKRREQEKAIRERAERFEAMRRAELAAMQARMDEAASGTSEALRNGIVGQYDMAA